MVNGRVGPPVRGSDFYGRAAFVDLVWEKLQGGHVILAAPRRFGKTSVMYRLIDEPRHDYRIVHADLEHFTDPAQLFTELITQLASDDYVGKAIEGISSWSKELWSAVRRNVSETEVFSFKLKLREEMRRDWQSYGEELFARLGRLDHPILFILDEFPMMLDRMSKSPGAREEAKTLLRWLRALRISPDAKLSRIRFLMAGSIGIDYVLHSLGETSSIINDFEQLRLNPFSRPVAKEFLSELAKADDVPLTAEMADEMLDLIGTLVPYFIQILFSQLAYSHKIDHEPITSELLNRVYRQKVLGVDCKTYFDHYYGRLRDYYSPSEVKGVRGVLRDLALKGSLKRDTCYAIYQQRLGQDSEIEQFNATMSNLENDFYIRFNDESSEYEFASKLLRDWWLRHYAMEVA